MPNFYCDNKDCKKFGQFEFYHKVKFKFDEMNCLEPVSPIICLECGKPMVQQQNTEITEINKLNIGSFKGMGDYDKRRHIKKRAKEHYKKNDSKNATKMKNDLIKRMKEGLES